MSSPIIGAIARQDDLQLRTALLILPAFSVVMILVNLAILPALRRVKNPNIGVLFPTVQCLWGAGERQAAEKDGYVMDHPQDHLFRLCYI